MAVHAQDASSPAIKPVARPQPAAASFTAPWQPLGPSSITSISYGALSGRVLSLAVDPNDSTGNTVYVGSAGGGVWKSQNMASPSAGVTFAPLTDTLAVFDSGYASVPSLFIGALAVQPAPNPVVLAGTGDPNNSADSYYGEGILRSADGGLTWKLIQTANDLPNAIETFSGLSTAAFAWSTAVPTLAVAAFTTSPQATVVDAIKASSVPGLYYSSDAGTTWHMATVYDGAQVVQQPQPLGAESGNAATSVVWNPQRKMFFAALRAHGYYASADGMTWKRLDVQPGSAMSAAKCPVGSNGVGSANCPVYRGTLTVQPTTGDTYAWTVDANSADQGLWQDLCALNSSGVCANAAAAFTHRLDAGAFEPAGSTNVPAGTSTLSLLAVSGANGGTTLLAGAADLFRCSLAAGATNCTFRNTTNAVNGCATPAGVTPGQHVLAPWPLTNGNAGLLVGSEGGLWRSADGANESGTACNADDANHFENLNGAIGTGGSAAQVVGFAQDATNTNILLAGFGANGTASTSASSPTAPWTQLAAGEGGLPHIDPSHGNKWYAAIGSGVNLKHCASGSSCAASDFVAPATIGAAQVSNDLSLLHAPSLLDSAQPANVILGTCRVWRGPATDGTLWSTANAIGAPFRGAAPCTSANPLVRSLAAGGPAAASVDAEHDGATVIYAGMAGLLDGGGLLIGGHLFMTAAADKASSTTQWTDISLGAVTNDTFNGGTFNPSGYSVSSVFVDPHDATGATVYATVMGFVGPHLYGSTDFGAHWLDLSSNLPNAPANSVVVDPNDANTVYIALDSGVYATTAISTCPTADCWSLLGTGLPNSPVTQLRAGAQLSTGDNRLGMLRASTYGRGVWQTPLLGAISVAAPALSSSFASLAFAAQQVGTQSDTQTVTFTSTGNAPAAIASLTISSGFTKIDTCSGVTLAMGGTCAAQVRFAPNATGSASGVLTLFANIAGGQVTVALSGSGTAPATVTLTPNSLTFSATQVNQSSATQNIVIANTGGNTAALQTPSVTGDFSIVANTCGSTLAVQTACALSIQFKPTDRGVRTGLLTVADSAGTQTASLTGTGNSPATDTLNVSSLTFAQQAVGSTSLSQQVTLTNAGDVPLLLTSVAATGDFTISNSCGTSLPAHGTCAVLVTFVPTAVGSRSGTLTIADQFRSQTVALTGTAVAPAGVSLSPAALVFADTGVGLSAAAQTVTLTNNGGLPLTIAKTSISGDFALAANTCGSTLAVNAACTMTIVFTPGNPGARSGTLTLQDNAPSGTQTVSLQGTGIDFTLVPSGATTQTVSSGTTATYAMLLNSVSGVTGNVAFGCTGAPAHAACTVNPSVAGLGTSTTVIVTVQTGLSTAFVSPRAFPWMERKATVLALLVILPVFGVRRRRVSRLLLFVAMFSAFALVSGCGTPRIIPGSGGGSVLPTPTPAGTYTLTVTGTTAGVSHTVPLTLVVQ